MRPLPFIWPYALIFWVVYLWAFAPEFAIITRGMRGASQHDSRDRGSVRVIMLGMWIALTLAFPIAFLKALRVPFSLNVPLFWIGTGTLMTGSLLRRHCFRVLGKYFTGDVQARADQPIIDRGAYRWVRHPSYTAGMAMFSGIGLALGSWASFAVLTLVSVAVYSYRVSIEERALVQTIGEPYSAFMRTRKRFLPFII